MRRALPAFLVLAVLLTPAVASAAAPPAVQPPVLKWQHGGCYSSWCETGWYSSPAVADLDGDGAAEVIGGAYSLFLLNGTDGSLRRQIDTPGTRIWPGVVVADIDADGSPEIAIAQGGGYVSVYNTVGDLEPGWPQQPVGNELRGLSVFDLDGDGTLEVIVTGAVYGKVNTWVFEHDGALRPGWPQVSDDSGYAYGVFNANATVGDVDGDGAGEVVVPSDVHYICAYEADGEHIPAHAMYGGKNWGQVGVWESPETELRGWGTCSAGDGREERYRANFAHGPAAIADVDGDGRAEVVATGNVYDCIPGYPSRYIGLYLFNADRSRFHQGGYDWRYPPIDTGTPLSEDYGLIENAQPNPAVADLDGDGHREVIFASYDGRVHAFWLDRTEHGDWPYAVYNPGEGFFRFASEPAVADLDGDGSAEVLFASWVQKGTNQTGRLHILDSLGHPLQEVSLPAAFGDNWNGALAAPTLADIDGDPDLEVVLNTAHSGLVAYDLPGTGSARILWGTGRGNYWRSGSPLYGSLEASGKSVAPLLAGPGEALTYTIVLRSPGPLLSNVWVSDTLPAEVHYAGGLWASAGSYGQAGGTITWTGAVQPLQPVTITFDASVDAGVVPPRALVNSAWIDDGWGHRLERRAVVVVGGCAVYLPLVGR